MPLSSKWITDLSKHLKRGLNLEGFKRRLGSHFPDESGLPSRLPGGNEWSTRALEKRRSVLREQGVLPESLCTDVEKIPPDALKGSIENHIGFCHIPVGVAGPLRVNGVNAHGDFYVPLATTEGALVASLNRGAYVISRSGGVRTLCLSESVSRAPAFTFESIVDACVFIDWCVSHLEQFKARVSETTRHGHLEDFSVSLNSRTAFLIFQFNTGDAAGQNMVTVATERICRWLVAQSPVKPTAWYVEGNLSGDKKATMLSFLTNRGRKVVAEVVLPRREVKRFLNTTPEAMAEYCRISTIGGVQSGSIGVQGHYANALAALFICCGQDVACLSEAAVGMTTMKVADDGGLYVSVSLPGIIVGTVGGGTHLPTARDALKMLGCSGNGKAQKFAEICAAVVVAGEVSIIAALASGDFARAHATFRRKS